MITLLFLCNVCCSDRAIELSCCTCYLTTSEAIAAVKTETGSSYKLCLCIFFMHMGIDHPNYQWKPQVAMSDTAFF